MARPRRGLARQAPPGATRSAWCARAIRSACLDFPAGPRHNITFALGCQPLEFCTRHVSTHHTVFVAAIAAFALAALAYYRAWAYLSALAATAYWAQCVWLGVDIVWPDMPVIFCLVTLIGVALPALCVVLFAIDVWLGAFTTDMTYGLALAWLLSPLPFVVNLLAHFMGGPAA